MNRPIPTYYLTIMKRLLRILGCMTILFSSFAEWSFGQCSNPTIPLPDASTPVNGNPATAYCTTFSFDPAMTGLPTGLSMNLQHTWQGDLSIFIIACNNTLMVMNRPGVVASCGGGCPCGNSNDIGSPGNPSQVTFSDGGGPDPENGIPQSGGNFGVTADNSCNVSTVNTFAALWASCPPGPITAQVCIADHAGADTGVASDVTFIYPTPVICGCTDPDASNYNPDATVDDGSCLPNCTTITVSSVPSNAVGCPGGSVTLNTTVTGAVGPVNFSWIGPNISFLSSATTANPTVNIPAGFTGTLTFTLTVTTQACAANTTVTIEVIPPSPPEITGPLGLCPGQGTASLSVEGSYNSYNWGSPPGGNTPSVTVNAPGTYSVTVTDANGCLVSGSYTLPPFPIPTVEITGPPSICDGGLVTLDAGPGYQEYLWSTGNSDQTVDVDEPGFYTVTVTSTDGCTNVGSFTLTLDSPPTPGIFGETQICPNSSLILSAEDGYSNFQWSTGSTDPSIEITGPGLYALTATNADGCIGTNSIIVTLLSTPQANIQGNTNICPDGENNLLALGGFVSFLWSTGESSQAITANQPGTYSVTGTSAEGCSAEASITLVPVPAPEPSVAGDLTICPGQTTSLNAGAGYSTYVWSEGSTGQIAVIQNTGTYSVTVTNSDNCQGVATVEVTDAEVPEPVISGPSEICPGGSATLNAGDGFASYLWSTGGNTAQIAINSTGFYIVTVTNDEGCTGTASFEVQDAPVPMPQIEGELSFCPGSSTSLSVGDSFSAYSWSTGSSAFAINVNAPGTYSVTVTNGFGCTNSTSVTTDFLPVPMPVISGPTGICPNSSGTLQVTDSYPAYSWSNGSTDSSTSINAPGTYAVTVTDANGCVGDTTFMVSLLPVPTPTITGVFQICPGGSTTLTASSAVSYQWSTGTTGTSITVDAAGSYAVTVTDENGCQGSANINVVQVPQLQPTIGGTPHFCTGSSTTLNVGSGYASYIWSNSSNTQSITVSTPGTYGVTVTDSNGCSGQTSVSVQERPLPMPQITGDLEYCDGDSVSLQVAQSFAAYQWSTSATSQGITLNVPGLIGVTVTDVFGCVGSSSVQVVEHPLVFPQISGDTTFCQGLQTALDAGPGYVSYQWSNSAATSAIEVTSGGNYSVTVTDANGCITQGAVTVIEFPVAVPQITGPGAFCSGNQVVLDAGSGFAQYAWSNAASGQTLEVTQGGFYGVTATDINGCVSSAGVQITEHPLPSVVISGSASFCVGGFTTISAGDGFAQYLWSNGQTTPTLDIAQAGLFAVTVTDDNGCTNSDDIQITQEAELNPQISGNLRFCPGTQTTLDAGPGFASYQWSNSSSGRNITVNQPGNYRVTVTDAFGCLGSGEVAVGLFPQPSPTIAGTPSFCVGNSTVLSSSATFVSYQWSTGATQPQITVSTPGNYGLTITDANGCVGVTSQAVEEFPRPAYDISGVDYFCTGAGTSLSVPGTFTSYIWSSGQQTPSIAVNTPGNYVVTVTNSFGCTAVRNIQVNQIPLPVADAGPAQELTCNLPSATLGGTGTSLGTAYIYQWTGPGIGISNATQRQPAVSVSGNYSLVVTDTVYGCVSPPSQVSVADLTALPTVNLQVLDTLDCITSSVLINSAGSSTGATIVYQWFDASGALLPGAGGQSYSTSAPGSYRLVLTNSYTGCRSEASIAVQQDIQAPIAEAGDPRHLTCAITAVALDGTASSSGGLFTSIWTAIQGQISSGSTGLTPVVNQPGRYLLTVRNLRNGCVSQDSVSVTQDIALPTAVANGDLEINCLVPTAPIDGNGSSSGGIFRYEWIRSGSSAIISTDLALEVSAPGIYTIRVINTDNGCIATDQVVITENPERPRGMEVTSDSPTCFGDTDGSIRIGAITGGIQPYLYSFNDSPFQSQTFFPELGAGDYRLVVQDATGCEFEVNVNLREGNDLELDLGPDQFIRIGQRAQIDAQYNIPDNEIASFQWTTFDTISCLNCPDIEVRPFLTMMYTATLVDTNGCRITDEITIFVRNPREVFIPNAFSPNNDGNNDRLVIFSDDDVEYVRSFMIFNRWGETVFEVFNFPTNDPAYGWDGGHREKLYNSNVFTYFAEVVFIDGSVKLFKGDVTLMR